MKPRPSYLLQSAILAGAILALSPVPLAVAANGDVSRDELDQLEAERSDILAQLQALEAAEDEAVSDLGTLERKLIAAALESRRREEQATSSELELISLNARLDGARRDLVEGEEALEDLLATLVISGRHRPPTMLVSADDANSAIRSAVIMGDIAPRLKARTTALTDEIDELRRLERLERREQAELATAEAALDLKQAEILKMTTMKRAAFEDVNAGASILRDRAQLLGREAETIRGLLAALEANAPSAPGQKPNLKQYVSTSPNAGLGDIARPTVTTNQSLASLGELDQPASGRLIRVWGDKMPGGAVSEGLTFATRAQAQVASPIDGVIEFAGPFRTFGQLLIISTSDDYHVVIYGMDEAYVGVGQTVKRGEPIARMQNRATPEPELFLEVRKDGKPMDPAKWMKRG